jgi:hypothetical protein
MILTVQSKNKKRGSRMKHSGKFFPGWPAQSTGSHQTEKAGHHVTLTLVDDRPHKEHGYNPYDTISHARAIRGQDVWRHKPKRA